MIAVHYRLSCPQFFVSLNGCASAAYCGHAHVTVITQMGSFIVNTSLGMSSITVQY